MSVGRVIKSHNQTETMKIEEVRDGIEKNIKCVCKIIKIKKLKV